MKTICIVRHAHARKGKDEDITRSLDKKGIKQATKAASVLHAKNIRCESLVCSSAIRAIETSHIICSEYSFPRHLLKLNDTMYDEPSNELFLETIRKTDDSFNSMFLVGHNPSLNRLAGFLLKNFYVDMPCASALIIDFDVNSWQDVTPASAQFKAYYVPDKNDEFKRLTKELRRKMKHFTKRAISDSIRELDPDVFNDNIDSKTQRFLKSFTKDYVKSLEYLWLDDPELIIGLFLTYEEKRLARDEKKRAKEEIKAARKAEKAVRKAEKKKEKESLKLKTKKESAD